MGIRALRRKHTDRILQRKVQHGFRRQLNLLSFGSGLHAAAESATGGRANASSFATSGNSTDDGANGGAGTHLLSGVLAARAALPFILIGLDTVRTATDGDAVELQYEQR